MNDNFNQLEISILEWFRNHYTDKRLYAQIEAARFLRRDWTKVGFYVYIEVPKELEPINLVDFNGNWPIHGPALKSTDIEHGGGVLLWGKDGYLNSIEMYAFGSYFNESVHDFELSK